MEFQQMQPKENQITYEIPGKTQEALGADIFTINNSHFHCVADHHSKFPIVKRAKGLIRSSWIVFAEYGLLSKNIRCREYFFLDKLKSFCKKLNTDHVIFSLCNDKSNGHAEILK